MANPDNKPTLESRLYNAMNTLPVTTYCSKAWLGHASAIFVEFEENPERNIVPSFKSELSTYSFHTHFSEWRIEMSSLQICDRQSDRKNTISIIRNLVGLKLLRVQLDQITRNLIIDFDEKWRIVCQPWAIADLSMEDLEADAWALKLQNEYFGVSCNGKVSLQNIHSAEIFTEISSEST